ncbi:hypothetical protein [Zavarzinia compransoris]|uniref:Uncharacterized protein n=1 Tax=Zavarzinia compransoris TaxID=1264899 RepID=A0A317DVV5_9PROT|nr:hypothetical protein [Zavarzinia compransoris]PWR18006.1 hypothetical protein DKG75_20930 [Zavarzinia compransoris]TDP43529.1 hypothetical protein DES42_11197 [Zavarzinia compransoris]
MDRDTALRLDGMAAGIIGQLDGLAFYMKQNLPAAAYQSNVKPIAHALAELFEFRQGLYGVFPDILPRELDPARCAI